MVINYLDFATKTLDLLMAKMIIGSKISPSLQRKIDLLSSWENEDLKRSYEREAG
jgi:hypothetical protein